MGRRTRRSERELAGLAVTGAVVAAAERAGELAGRAREGAGDLVERASPIAERVAERVAVGAGELAERAAPLRDRVVDSAGELAVAAAPVVGSAVETVSGVLEDALGRGGAAWDALRGERVGPPAAVRRWPWALGAALLGAAAGAAAAAVVRKVAPADAPGAQEPHELLAVVDTADAPAARRSVQDATDDPVPAPPVERTTFEM